MGLRIAVLEAGLASALLDLDSGAVQDGRNSAHLIGGQRAFGRVESTGWDRRFESGLLHWRVSCEPVSAELGISEPP
jgi:hypothetical protein